jgi:aminoglycoside phosphotransferase (APT) family kinase protein
MKTVPHDATHPVDAGWSPPPQIELIAALQAWLGRLSSSRCIVDVEMRPFAYASSFAIEEADVRFDDGSVLELVCKATDEEAMLTEARRIKPRFLHHPRREILTYERLLAPLDVGAPRFYGSAVDPRTGHRWIFLERVCGVPLTEVGDFGVWQQACRWLASMHHRMAGDPGAADAIATVPLVQYDRAHAQLWMSRAQEHVQADVAQPRTRRERFASLAPKYDAVLDEIAAEPAGFMHGEFFASNVLVETVSGQGRIRPIDWEVAGVGPVLMDLAALTAGRWTQDERTQLASAYRTAAAGLTHAPPPPDDFMRALDCCRLQLAVERLGWARRWTPPVTHSQDWLGDAMHAADRLGL